LRAEKCLILNPRERQNEFVSNWNFPTYLPNEKYAAAQSAEPQTESQKHLDFDKTNHKCTKYNVRCLANVDVQ